MFKPSKLRTYLMLAQDAGLDPVSILAGSGTSWDEIETLTPLELEVIAGLFDTLAARTPPGFAIASGNVSKVRNYGIVGFATMSMSTLRDALQHWSRYCLVAGDPLITSISENGDEWTMNFKPRLLMSARAERFCIEAAVAALEPVIEELTGTPANTTRIEFAFGQPLREIDYQVFRTSDLCFDRPATIYHGRRSDLDQSISARDSAVRDMFLRQCDQFLSELTRTRTLGNRVDDLLRESGGHIPSLEAMATALGVSRRSLQRGLGDAGLSYRQIVRDFRMKYAMMLLREKHENVKTIAHMLGFADAGSFRRIFQEWTGQSVRKWQADQWQYTPEVSAGRTSQNTASL